MLGLVLIYFLGKYFYDLAATYKKNQWGYSILGVVTYYVGTFIGGFTLVLLVGFFDPDSVENIDDTFLGILALPFGLLAAWGLYKFLEKRFINELKSSEPALQSDILDDDFLN